MKKRRVVSSVFMAVAFAASASVNYLIVNEGRWDVRAFTLKDLTEIKLTDSGLRFVGKETGEISFADLVSFNFADSAPAAVEAVPSDDGTLGVMQNGAWLPVSGLREGESIGIYSVDGKLSLFRDAYNGEALDVSRLPSGIYIVRGGNQAIKFIKK